MPRIKDASVEAVKAAADIVQVIQTRTQLRKAGARWSGRCPFHEEKTASFSVNAVDKLFYCFGCGTGGDVFKFLTLTERFTFPEAVEHVASRVGIELPKKKRTPKESDKDDLLEVIDELSRRSKLPASVDVA